jgi:hypothetical protein
MSDQRRKIDGIVRGNELAGLTDYDQIFIHTNSQNNEDADINIQLSDRVTEEDVLRLLKKIRKWIKFGGFRNRTEKPLTF